MTSKKSINVGIIGFGTVGAGSARILTENADIIKRRLGAPVVLRKISDLDIKRDRGIKLGQVKLTTDAKDIIGDPDIDIVVELIGGGKTRQKLIFVGSGRKKHRGGGAQRSVVGEGREENKTSECERGSGGGRGEAS